MNLALLWWPAENWRFEPYLEAGEKMGKIWDKWMKR
jgi:hypothetical protein